MSVASHSGLAGLFHGMDISEKEALIAQVRKRSVIWNRWQRGHSNRFLVDKAWSDIAAALGVEDDITLRKRWKYLRDQFAIEIGKYPHRGSGNRTSNWPYFNSMQFLIGHVKPRILPKKKSEDQQESESFTETVAESADTTEEVESKIFVKHEILQDDTPSTKRSRYDYNYGENESSLPENGIQVRKFDESDVLFFRSLSSHVNRIPEHLKLNFRSRVLQLVQEFAYPNQPFAPSPTSSCGGVTSSYNEQSIIPDDTQT